MAAAQPIDYEKLSAEELRALAIGWASEAPVVEDKPRSDDGRFVAAVKEDAPAEEVVYERTIDLGDGSGVQVFEAPTMEELIDKLAKAQENATRKIREQAAQIKAQPKEVPAPDELDNLSEADKFLLQQEMLTDPVKAIQKFVAKAVDKREREATKAFETTKSESDAFVANNPDYYGSQKNGTKLVKWLEISNLDVTEENLKQAFDDLSASGLLEARPADDKETPVVPGGEVKQAARIEPTAPVQTLVRRKVVGGVSVKRSAPAPVQSTEPTEKQLREMPMQELEEITRRALMRG